MKKGKTTLAAVTLGALTYLAWLGIDIKNPEKPEPVSTPYEIVAETEAPVAPAPTPRRALARKHVKLRKPKAVATADTATGEAANADSATATPVADVAEKKPNVEIPLPGIWEGSFVKLERQHHKKECDLDRPCEPRGRDGVLLVGASFSLNGWKPIMPEILAVGAYERRTPLLVYQ